MHRKISVLLLLFLAISVNVPLRGTPVAAQQTNCPGAPPSRLAIGGHGQVTVTPSGQVPVPIRVRETPGRSGKVIGQLRDGMAFEVKEGPTCKDSYAWWHIVAESLEGWVAEGDSNGYYVEPTETTGDAGGSKNPQAGPTATLAPVTATAERDLRFAEFRPGQVDTTGSLQPYQVAPDFANVVVAAPLTADQLNYLQRNGFVVSPGNELEFYTVYEKARYNYQPLFITTDSLLHSFHLIFDKVLRSAETEYFIPLLRQMNASVLIQADKQYQALKGTDWEESARRTVAYVGVAARLVDSQAQVPSYAADLVTTEIANVNSAFGVAASAIFPELDKGEDWTQYIARGHYTKSEPLKAYFRAMMYYGRMTFRLSRPEETKSGLLLATAIRDANVNGRRGIDAWADLYEPTVFFVGKSDDLTVPQYLQVIDQIYGNGAPPNVIQGKGIDAFVTAAKALPSPKILGAVIQDTDDIDEETKGLRFMGQRFVWDAYVFRQLVYRNVGTRDEPRALPMALDVFAALGSERALSILDKEGATSFENYLQQMQKVRGEVGKITEADWTETLYGSWLYTLNALPQPVPSGYPSFMMNPAYQDRSLYAALGSYAELKHDTILYAKQVYAEAGGGGGKSPPPDPVVPPNYVEPLPLFWARLAALAEMTHEGLSKRQLLNETDSDTLQRIAVMARRFQDYSVKELKNQPLTAEEQNSLRFYGRDLEHLMGASVDEYDKSEGPGGFFLPEEMPQAAVVADIATAINAGNTREQKVLEVGVGRVFDMYAAVPIDGKLYMAHGAVFSYYEFEQPLNRRLTDEEWRKMLAEGKAPPLPGWTFSFLSKSTVEGELAAGVLAFQRSLTDTLWWDPVRSYDKLLPSVAQDKVTQWLVSQLEPLAKARQYEGRQIIATSFRSVDLQNANTAIVTTRETWRGELHNNAEDPSEDGPKIAERGPYTIDVTYTLSKNQEGMWTVTNIVVNGALPAWKQTTS
jgi:hypothetical protein